MSGFEDFRYDGKRVLVVGGATGMGAAAAQTAAALGAEVAVMDIAPIGYPVAQAIQVDLRDRAGLDTALEQVDGPVQAVFCAAGIADGPGVMKVNFIAHRHLLERMIDDGRLGAGSAACLISSVAGLGWLGQLDTLVEFLDTPDYESADAWVSAHDGSNTYTFSKQVMNAYVARQSYPLASKGIRINAICPGPTDTPLARANGWLDAFGKDFRDATGTPVLVPEQMGNVMLFLNSDAASGISGATLLVDSGHIESSIAGTWEAGGPVVQFLMAADMAGSMEA